LTVPHIAEGLAPECGEARAHQARNGCGHDAGEGAPVQRVSPPDQYSPESSFEFSPV
jgi:hypothetical protein